MKTYVALFGEAFILSLVLTPIAISVFGQWGLLDLPDNKRKLHSVPVPRLGGLAIVIAIAITFASLWMVPNESGWLLISSWHVILKFALPAALILAVGVIDDLRPLPAVMRFAVQILAATMVWIQGISFTVAYASDFGFHTTAAVIGYLATVVWIVGITNAFNLLDGLDGLTSGVAFLAALTMLVSATFFNNEPIKILVLPICGALLGFLPYNFNPARIFLGDCGSTFLGFILATIGLTYSQKKTTLIAVALPFVALGLPIVDTGLAILRRLIRGVPIFSGDRSHIHHRLLGLGISPRRAVLILYGISLTFTVLALVMLFATEIAGAVVITIFAVIVIIGIRILRYSELQEVAGSLGRSLLFSVGQARDSIALRDMCEELGSAASLDQIESILERVAGLISFDGFRLDLSPPLAALLDSEKQFLGRKFFESRNAFSHPDEFWTVRIPLGPIAGQDGNGSWLVFYRELTAARSYFQINFLVNVLAPPLKRALQQVYESSRKLAGPAIEIRSSSIPLVGWKKELGKSHTD